MKYALNLAVDGRILSATYEEFAPINAVLVDKLPEGNVADYLYVDGQYVHDPLPVLEQEHPPTLEDRVVQMEAKLNALLGVAE